MDQKNMFYDLYLYVIPENNHLYKIQHLKMHDAHTYADWWINMNELHDYMLVTEDSTPWTEPIPTIEIKTPEWLISEHAKLNKEQ